MGTLLLRGFFLSARGALRLGMTRFAFRWPPRKRRRVVFILVGLLGVAVIGLAATGGLGGNELMRRITNEGSQSSIVRPRDEQALQKLGVSGSDTALLAVHGDRAYYRVGGGCYAVGPAVSSDYVFGQIACATGFPSAEQPFLDFTVFRTRSDSQAPHAAAKGVWRSEGFAADGIDKVAFFGGDGTLVAETDVVNNTYRFAKPPEAEVAVLRAFNAAGETVAEKRFAPPERSGG